MLIQKHFRILRNFEELTTTGSLPGLSSGIHLSCSFSVSDNKVKKDYNQGNAWSTHRLVRVGAIFFGFYWFWCGAVRVFHKFCGSGAVRNFENFFGPGPVRS